MSFSVIFVEGASRPSNNKIYSERHHMRETRTGPSRGISTRSSKPSTSSGSENFATNASSSSRRKPAARRQQGDDSEDSSSSVSESCSMSAKRNKQTKSTNSRTQVDTESLERSPRSLPKREEAVNEHSHSMVSSTVPEATPTSGASKVNGGTPSASSVRRSAREPRPKRTLSPTPLSPKRRAKRNSVTHSQTDSLKGTESLSTVRKVETKGSESAEAKSSSSNFSSQSALPIDEYRAAAGYESVQSMGASEGADYGIVADDDMENDLVDIQPFETSDTINELLENVEHSTEDPCQPQKLEAVPCLDNEIVISSASDNQASVADTHTSASSQNSALAVVEGQSSQGFEDDEENAHCTLGSFSDDRCQSFSSTNSGDYGEGEASSQLEPPMLDGPIMEPTTYELKPNIDSPPKLVPDGVVRKGNPKPVHYVVGEIYRVHTPNGTEQEVQLAVMDDGSEALVNARGEIVDLTPEDSYATIDICDIDFSFLDDKNIVCGLCGEVVAYSTLFSGHLSRVHPEMLDPDMMIGQLPYVEYLKRKLESDRKNIQNGFKLSKQTLFRRTPRKVSQIRINPSEMTLPQLEVALKKKLLEKMGRRVKVSLVDKEHVKCGLCNSVISINKKFEIVHVVRHFNAWHPTNHQCAGQWQKRTQRPGVGKPLSKQDFAVIDLSHTQPDNLQCIWCGMFIDATTIAVHFTECHPGEVEVPKCLLCIQELVINARVIEKFGSDFDIVLRDEFHIKVGKLNKLFTSESLMDNAIEKYLEGLNGKRKRAPLTVERRVFEGDSVVVHTTAIPGDDDSADDMDEDVATRPRKSTLQTNSRQVFGRHNRPKRSMVQPIYRQAPPTNSEYVTVVSDSHWKCKICDADLYGAVISACAIRHFKLKHPQESDSLQFEVVRARLDRISDGCMEFVHPQMLECLICHLTYQLHKPYNVCRGIRHLKSRHPEIMPEFNGEALRRYKKTGTALRLDDDPNIPRRRKDTTPHAPHPTVSDGAEVLAKMKAQYPGSFDKVHAVYGGRGEPMFVLMNDNNGNDEVAKNNLKILTDAVVSSSRENKDQQDQHIEDDDEEVETGDVKPGKEVVFELSYDYNNLDAEGKPQKHLVRVTPSNSEEPANNVQSTADNRRGYFMESEVGTEDLNPLEQAESNEVFFAEADRADAGSVDESDVVLGDVFFIDPDGNEIIQRTTALPDGTIQTQYLGQAEDGSLFELNDIVSAGLHPCDGSVEEVYDDDDEIAQELVLQEEYESQRSNAAIHRYQHVRRKEYGGHQGQEMNEVEYDDENAVIVENPYEEGVVVVQEGYTEGVDEVDGRAQYSGEVVAGDDAQYGDDDMILQDDEYSDEIASKNRDASEIEHSAADAAHEVVIGGGRNRGMRLVQDRRRP